MANILYDLQNFVADKLNSELSSVCPFIPENRKDVDFEIKNALGKQGIVGLVLTPKARYLGNYEDKCLAWEIEQLQVFITENVTVNRHKLSSEPYATGQDVSMEVFRVMCPLSGEGEGQFSPVGYEQGEDGSLLVNKCELKCALYGDATPPAPPVPVYPTKQQVLFRDGTTVQVADNVFMD